MENRSGEVLTIKGRYDKNEEKKRKEKETREAKKKKKIKDLEMFSLIFIKEATSRKIVQKERINLKNQCRHLAIVEEEGYESAGMCITTNNNKKR